METTEVKPEAKCACVCHKMFGVFVILGGIVGLLWAFGVLDKKVVGIAGSSLAILAGLQTLFRRRCTCCNAV